MRVLKIELYKKTIGRDFNLKNHFSQKQNKYFKKPFFIN